MDENPQPRPEWLGPLCEQIGQELDQLVRSQHDHRPALEQEAADLQACLNGWSVSLAKADLPACVRADLEAQYAQARGRLQVVEGDLAELDSQRAQQQQVVDPRQVLDCLSRLDQVLASGNAPLGNLELSRHIDRIDVHADGRVVMRTSKLGIFEGAVALLARSSRSTPPATDETTTKRIQPRRRGRVRIDQPLMSGPSPVPEIPASTDPGRFAGLDPQWFWEDVFEMPRSSCWAAEHASAVAQLRGEGWTMARLASHFGRTRPTIRHALKIAAERGLIPPPAARHQTEPAEEAAV